MKKVKSLRGAPVSAALALLLASGSMLLASPAHAGGTAVSPTGQVTMSVGSGRMFRLDSPITDLFVADPGIADVQVRSANQIYIFGKTTGETSVYATNAAGRVVYSSNVRVGNNIDSVDGLLKKAMPDSPIEATTMNGMILLTGTVRSPDEANEAANLVQAFVGDNTKVISRLKTATPLQVMLKVKIAEVSRSLVKSLGVNLLSGPDKTGGFLFGVSQGRGAIPNDLSTIKQIENGTTIGLGGKLFGLDVRAAIDLAENDGLVTTLAEPSLTALSGETASFLAGGEFPIPISQSLGSVAIEYKSYGVGLAFTPTVLDNGRISMRVRPEVSELSTEGSVKLGSFEVPGITTRRAETTVELGSGQSFVIGGLLRNTSNNTVQKAPWLGDLPILGTLFRSNRFRRAETELVIVVTPYLVKPVSDRQIALPTDGVRTGNDAQRILLDQQQNGVSGAQRPVPIAVQPPPVSSGARAANAPPASVPATQNTATAQPGFSFN